MNKKISLLDTKFQNFMIHYLQRLSTNLQDHSPFSHLLLILLAYKLKQGQRDKNMAESKLCRLCHPATWLPKNPPLLTQLC